METSCLLPTDVLADENAAARVAAVRDVHKRTNAGGSVCRCGTRRNVCSNGSAVDKRTRQAVGAGMNKQYG